MTCPVGRRAFDTWTVAAAAAAAADDDDVVVVS